MAHSKFVSTLKLNTNWVPLRPTAGRAFESIQTEPDDYKDVRQTPISALIKAAVRGSLEDVTALLDRGVNPNTKCGKKIALCEASASGRHECVRALLAAGADPNQRTEHGLTPLMVAISHREDMCVRVLIDHKETKLDLKDWNKTTLVMYAARVGDFLLTKVLLEKYSEGGIAFGRRDLGLNSVWTHAATNGQRLYLHQLKSLVEPTADLIEAATNGESRRMRRLLEEDGQDPDQTDDVGLTALIVCCMMDYRDCLRVLTDFPIDVNKWDETGRQAIHYAAGCGNAECMETLLAMGACASLATRLRETPLSLAAKNGFANCVRVAISAMRVDQDEYAMFPCSFNKSGEGAFLCSFDARDTYDKTAMMYASDKGFFQIVELLLDSGACATTTSKVSGKNALIYAAASGHVPVVELLLQRGAEVNAVDNAELSALFYAASGGHVLCVSSLLRAGALIYMSTEFKHNPLAIALDRGHTRCAVTMIRVMSRSQMAMSDIGGMNWVLYIARCGDVECLRLFFESGVRLQSVYCDCMGNTPLMYAAANWHLETMRYLIQGQGLVVNERNLFGHNALGIAVFYNAPDTIISYLISENSSVLADHEGSSFSPLFYACLNGNASQIRLLLAAGADVSLKDEWGNSAIYSAIKKGDPDIVGLIIEAEEAKGPLLPNECHKRALFYAVECGYTLIVAEFLKHGVFDWSWYPDCMLNVRGRIRLLAKSLVTLGISPGVFTYKRERSSPLGLALQCHDMATAKYLVGNLYLSDCDFTNMYNNTGIRKILKGNAAESTSQDSLYGDDKSAKIFAKNLYNGPLLLATMCFLKVSSAIGQHCGLSDRKDAVAQLPIPNRYKTKLAFQEPIAKLCVYDWKTIDLEERVHDSGQKVYGLFKECTQIEGPLSTSRLHKCKRWLCLCGKEGLSFYKKHELPYERQLDFARQGFEYMYFDSNE